MTGIDWRDCVWTVDPDGATTDRGLINTLLPYLRLRGPTQLIDNPHPQPHPHSPPTGSNNPPTHAGWSLCSDTTLTFFSWTLVARPNNTLYAIAAGANIEFVSKSRPWSSHGLNISYCRSTFYPTTPLCGGGGVVKNSA